MITGSSFVSYHGNESLIYHNYVNCDLKVKASKILTCERSISDHYATLLMRDGIKPLKPKRQLIKTRSFKKLNPLLFYKECALLPFQQIAADPNLSIHKRAEMIEQSIINIVDIVEKTM